MKRIKQLLKYSKQEKNLRTEKIRQQPTYPHPRATSKHTKQREDKQLNNEISSEEIFNITDKRIKRQKKNNE